MRRLNLFVAAGFAAILASGCALTQGNIKVGYDPANTRKGPLSSFRPVSVQIQEFADKRAEINKVGYKRNAYGSPMAPIVTTEPVPQIVREAIATEFSTNGHRVVASASDVLISGEITSFWFNSQVNFWTVEFMGTVGVNATVVDTRTGGTVFSANYEGHYNEKSTGGLEKTWERVMNTALERMVQSMSSDRKLVESLKLLGEQRTAVPQ